MFFSLTSPPFSRSPGRGSYGSPPSFKRLPCSSSPSWLVLPTYPFFTPLFFSQCWLINSGLDRCCMWWLPADNWLAPITAACDVKINCCSVLKHRLGTERAYSCSLSRMWRHVYLEVWNDDVVWLFCSLWQRPGPDSKPFDADLVHLSSGPFRSTQFGTIFEYKWRDSILK